MLQLPPSQGGQLQGAVTCSGFAPADQPDPGGLLHGFLDSLVGYLLALQKQELNPTLTLGHTCRTTGVT